jgi:hypothetical protein
MKPKFVPETPGGSVLMNLAANTEDQAWKNLMRDAAHMPYKTKEGFVNRGYKVSLWTPKDPT